MSSASYPAWFKAFNAWRSNRKLRKSALLGPFTTNQKIKIAATAAFFLGPWIMIGNWAWNKDFNAISPLAARTVQDFDSAAFLSMYEDHLKVLSPLWINAERRAKLSSEELAEIDFLRDYKFDLSEKARKKI